MQTIKELNKELNEKAWYRLLKVLWSILFFVLLVLLIIGVSNERLVSISDYSLEVFFVFLSYSFTFVGCSVALKRAIIYGVDYVVTGKVFLREKWYFLLIIALLGIFSIFILFVLFYDLFNTGSRF